MAGLSNPETGTVATTAAGPTTDTWTATGSLVTARAPDFLAPNFDPRIVDAV